MSTFVARLSSPLFFLFASVCCAQSIPEGSHREQQLNAEVDRLKGVVERSFQEKMRYKKKLKEARGTIDRLQSENAELRKLVKISKVGDSLAAAGEELLRFFEWMDTQLAATKGATAQRRWLFSVLSGAMEDWASDNAAGRTLLRPSLSLMKKRVEQLDAITSRQAEGSGESERTASESEVWIRPQAICDLLEVKNAEDRVQFLSRLIGRRVYWEGTVAGGIDDRNAPYQVELRRDDVVIFVNVRKKKPGALKWLKIGEEVRVEGEIADIGDTIGSCISVLIVNGKLTRPW